ncbi:hypothetical protein FH972_022982 [Carpinus fangiana]|uniref:Uncharacterized protein n=1 Tax=Carpinus fangiana TaxID=176857 RepID=A0A5N6KTV4_9ROSI|nr:hypothetical protein FH972_022982 [Carpinus fangiana]
MNHSRNRHDAVRLEHKHFCQPEPLVKPFKRKDKLAIRPSRRIQIIAHQVLQLRISRHGSPQPLRDRAKRQVVLAVNRFASHGRLHARKRRRSKVLEQREQVVRGSRRVLRRRLGRVGLEVGEGPGLDGRIGGAVEEAEREAFGEVGVAFGLENASRPANGSTLGKPKPNKINQRAGHQPPSAFINVTSVGKGVLQAKILQSHQIDREGSVMSFFRKAKAEEAPVHPTDTIIPLHPFDDNDITRGSLLYITLFFEHVLDVEKLRHGMEELLTIGDWRKLGARLRKTVSSLFSHVIVMLTHRFKSLGKFEYHVPQEYTTQRPGFIFSHEQHDVSEHDHPLAQQLPRPTPGQPSIQHDAHDFLPLSRRNGGPKKLEDFLSSDEPQVSLHIVSFLDATLVSISWQHTLCDATAMSEVLKAWLLILDGRKSEVPQVSPIAIDPLVSLGTSPTEPSANASRQLAGISLVLFFLRFFANLIWYKNSQRIVYLPPNYVQDLKSATIQEGEAASGKPVRLSEGDILSALFARLALRKASPKSTQNVTVWNVLDLRTPLGSTLLPPSAGIYLGNAVLGAIAFTSVQQILEKSLYSTAACIRKAIEEQRTPEQVHALAALSRKAEAEGKPCLFGDGGSKLLFFSNWTRAGFFQLDFGSALATGAGKTGPALPTMVLFSSEAQHPLKTNTILGKDAAGGYWIEFNMEDGSWEGAQELLEQHHLKAGPA